MQTCCIIIVAGQDCWQLAIVSEDEVQFVDVPPVESASPADIAAAIESTMTSAGVVGSPIMLAVPSGWCLSASIETSDLPRNDRTALLYRLEEKLPVAAETIAADFVESDGHALGVCVQLERIRPLIDALEARHVIVQSVSPLALLAAQHGAPDTCVMLLGEQGANQVNILKVVGGVVQSWSLMPANAAAIGRQLNFMALKGSSVVACTAVGVTQPLLQELQKQLDVQRESEDVTKIACQQARRVLGGEVTLWVELRRGPLAISDRLRLHRRPLNFLLASVIMLLLASSAALLWRASRYAQVDLSARLRMEDAFREHFPDWALPENVRVIVESEHQKAVAAAGGMTGGTTRSATRTLVDVLNHLPPDGRFSIESMSFADKSFELQGRVRSLDALDPLITAVKTSGMTVSSPEAHKIAGGMWSFAVRGANEASTPLAKGDQ